MVINTCTTQDNTNLFYVIKHVIMGDIINEFLNQTKELETVHIYIHTFQNDDHNRYYSVLSTISTYESGRYVFVKSGL